MVRNAGSLAVRASRSGGAIVTDEPHGADTYRKKVDTGVGYIILVTYDPDRWRLSRGAKAKLKNRVQVAQLTIEVEDKFFRTLAQTNQCFYNQFKEYVP